MADWTPYYLPNKLLWLRAADLVGTVDDGAEVLTWSDKSGNGFDATGTAGTAPTFDVDGFNGYPTLAFDGTEFLTTADLDASGEYTIFAVVLQSENIEFQPILSAINSYSLSLHLYVGATKRFFTYFYDSSGNMRYALVSNDTNQPSIYSATYSNDAPAQITIDGDASTETSSGIFSIVRNALSSLYLGKYSEYYITGDISEILIFNSALSDADREKVEGYLAHDYGLESELPEDHTYYSAAPQIDYRETWFSGNIPHGDFIRGATGTDPSSQVIFGTPSTVSFSTSAGTSSALTSQIVRLQSTIDVRLDFGATPSPSSTHGMFLPANTQEILYLTPGTKIGAVGAASGTLYIEQSEEV